MRIHDAAVMIAYCVSEHRVEDGMDEGCEPLPTHPKRYCHPASLDLSNMGETEQEYTDARMRSNTSDATVLSHNMTV